MNNIFKLGLIIAIVLLSISSAVAPQDPYPMDGYVVFENGTAVGAGANVTFTNQNTGEVIYDDTSASGWYSNTANNYPSGYSNGDAIAYSTVFGEYTNTTSHVINVTAGSHTMNIFLEPPLKGDINGDSQITSTDAAIALQMAVGSIPFESTADMNNDGKVTSLDSLLILQAVK